MSCQPESFEDILGPCFDKALVKARAKMKDLYNWLPDKRFFGKLSNWSHLAMQVCWSQVVLRFQNADWRDGHPVHLGSLQERFPGRCETDGESMFVKLDNTCFEINAGTGYPRLHFHPQLPPLDFFLPDGEFWHPTGTFIGLLPELMESFDRVYPELLPEAEAAMKESLDGMALLHAQDRIVRQAVKAWADANSIEAVAHFSAESQKYWFCFKQPGFRDVTVCDIPLDGIGDFLKWIPAYYEAVTAGLEFPVPQRRGEV